jgi:predicted PurR-regulated permease PerM
MDAIRVNEAPSDPPPPDSELPRISNNPVAPETKRGRRIALAMLLMVSFLTVAWIASPLWVGIMLGTVMAFTAQPVYRKLASKMGNRKLLAAALVTAMSGLVTAVVFVLALYILSNELIALVGLLQKKVTSGSLSELIGERGARLLARAGMDNDDVIARLRMELAAMSQHAAAAAGAILQATTTAMLSLVMGLLTMYYVLLEWPLLAARLEGVLPLDPKHTRALILEFREVGRSSFVGTIATALVQGLFGWMGYAMAGVPHAVTFGLLTAFASFLPLVGTALVWGTLPIYMLMSGHLGSAVFVFAWGFIVVMGVSDYIIRPRLVGKGHGHPLLMLVALLGGIEAIGLAGLIVAPIVMSLFLAVLRIYERETGAHHPEVPGPELWTPVPRVRIIERRPDDTPTTGAAEVTESPKPTS